MGDGVPYYGALEIVDLLLLLLLLLLLCNLTVLLLFVDSYLNIVQFV